MTDLFSSAVSLLALVVAILAFTVSALTAWLTLLRKGEVRMTQPTVIYFGPDGGFKAEEAPQKVFLRTLLFSTGKQGHIIERLSSKGSVTLKGQAQPLPMLQAKQL